MSRRRRDLEKNEFIWTHAENCMSENYTRAISRIDRNSHQKLVRNRQIKEEIEMEHFKSLRDKESKALELQREQENERAKSAQFREETQKRVCDDKKRQQLREKCDELRELEQKLRNAYVAKEISAQMSQKKAQQLQDQIEREKEKKLFEKQRLAELEEVRMIQGKREEDKRRFRETLQQQMLDTYELKRVPYEEFLKEKEWIDEVIRRIQDEQMLDSQLKLQRIQESDEELKAWRRSQELWKKQQKQLNEEENARISKYLSEKNHIEQLEKKRAEEKKLLKSNVTEKLSGNLIEIEQENQRRAEVMVELNTKAVREKEEEKIRRDLENQLRKRINVRIELEKQREQLWLKKEREKEEERMYKEEQLQLFAERDRIELMSNEMRRRKQIEHRKELQELLEDRKKNRVQMMHDLKQDHENEIKEAQKLQAMIEEERIKILKEHAANLVGFLPLGILRDTDSQVLSLPSRKSKLL